MKIVEPSIEKINFDIPGKKMEYCGRICYKSDSKINDDSYVKFIGGIVNRGHLSILEHERVCFEEDLSYNYEDSFENKKYFTVSVANGKKYISANVRAWYENTNKDDFFYPELKRVYPFIFTDEPTYKTLGGVRIASAIPEQIRKYHDSKTFKIVCSRACSHQIVRHRCFVYSQESQRYVNYTADKFGNDISFIMPVFDENKSFDEAKKEIALGELKSMFEASELNYFFLVKKVGLRPEDARCVLPNATATTIMMTGTTNEWEHFFEMRCDPHAQYEVRFLANKIKEEIND